MSIYLSIQEPIYSHMKHNARLDMPGISHTAEFQYNKTFFKNQNLVEEMNSKWPVSSPAHSPTWHYSAIL